MKEDLIELFKKSCNNFSFARSNQRINVNIDSGAYSEIKNMLPKQISVPGLRKPFYVDTYNISNSLVGFMFKDEPPIGIGSIYKTYKVKYGYFFPIISYTFWNNYIKRKKYCDFVINNWISGTDYDYDYCSLEKKIWFDKRARFIIHGTLVAEISFDEYLELYNLYKSKVVEYDQFKLKERLGK